MTLPSNPEPGSVAASLTGLLRQARLSRNALDDNVSALLVGSDASTVVVDVRADAYGHGLSGVVAAAAEQGIRRFRISPGVTLTAGLTSELDAESPAVERSVYGFESDITGIALTPVLSLVGEVVAVKAVPAGSAVSYGYTYRTDAETTLALVALGYADGVPRLGSNRATASIAGTLFPIAGRIAMDQFVLDVGAHVVAVGDEVTVWGQSPTIREWAAASRRSPQSLTAGVARRVSREWTGSHPS